MPKEPKALENADKPVYVTQGTVQLERLTESKAEMFINPTPDYAVKHNEKDYVVFVEAESLQPQSRLFDRKKEKLHSAARVFHRDAYQSRIPKD
jgi:hypothetical protein